MMMPNETTAIVIYGESEDEAEETPPPSQSLASRILSKLKPQCKFTFLINFLTSYHSMVLSLTGMPATSYGYNFDLSPPPYDFSDKDDVYIARTTMTIPIRPARQYEQQAQVKGYGATSSTTYTYTSTAPKPRKVTDLLKNDFAAHGSRDI